MLLRSFKKKKSPKKGTYSSGCVRLSQRTVSYQIPRVSLVYFAGGSGHGATLTLALGTMQQVMAIGVQNGCMAVQE